MNKQIESLKLALDALEINLTLLEKITPYKGQEDFLSDAIAITQDTTNFIKKTLAQPEQEPVAWMTEDECDVYTSKQVDGYFQHDHIPLYTTPPQRTWVGLTADEIFNTLISVDEKTARLPYMLGQFACAIEAKLKQKNGYAEEKNNG